MKPGNFIEGETLRPKTPPVHKAGLQDIYMIGQGWNSGRFFLWSPTDVGENLEIDLPVQKAGTYLLKARYSDGPTYGTFQMNLNGTDVGTPVDLFDPTVKPGDVMDVGTVTIPDGKPTLKITVTGKNSSATGTNFGLDYLQLVPSP